MLLGLSTFFSKALTVLRYLEKWLFLHCSALFSPESPPCMLFVLKCCFILKQFSTHCPLKHRNGVSRGIATGINNLWFVGLSEQDKLRYFGLSIKSIDSQFRGGCQAYNIMQPHIIGVVLATWIT